MLWAGERAALRSWAFSVLMEERSHSTTGRGTRAVGLQKGVMGNLSLYVAREPPSTSLATVLAQKKGSVLHLLIVRESNSLSCHGHAFHSLTRLSRTKSLFFFGGRSSLSSYPSAKVHIFEYRKKGSVAIRTTGFR